jgi:hypothetical protein
MAALAFALVLSLSYLSFEFALRRKPRAAAPLMVKAMGKGGGVD